MRAVAVAVCVVLCGLGIVASQSVNPNGYHYSDNALTELMLRIMAFEKPMQGVTGTNATVCWKDSYGRGVGKAISACSGDNPDKSGLLCYPACKPNYHGAGPVCWSECDAGYTDEGALCSRAGSIISADNSDCPWYDKCGLTFKKGCSKCPPQYHNDGCTCRIDPHVYAKDSYGRGAGVPLGCGSLEEDAALCYPYCTDKNNASYSGVGPVCWEECPAKVSFGAGAICCTSAKDCNEKVVELSQAVITAIASALAAGEDPSQIIAAVKAAIEAILGFVLPLCYDFV